MHKHCLQEPGAVPTCCSSSQPVRGSQPVPSQSEGFFSQTLLASGAQGQVSTQHFGFRILTYCTSILTQCWSLFTYCGSFLTPCHLLTPPFSHHSSHSSLPSNSSTWPNLPPSPAGPRCPQIWPVRSVLSSDVSYCLFLQVSVPGIGP